MSLKSGSTNTMPIAIRSGKVRRRRNENLRLIVTTFTGVVLGFFLGASISLNKNMNLHSIVHPSIHLRYIKDKYPNLSAQQVFNIWSSLQPDNVVPSFRPNGTKIWASTNPRGAERLPPGVVVPESDLYLRRLWGNPNKDLIIKPKYLVTFSVCYGQKENIDKAVKKFSENFSFLLFHYDGRTSEWNEFEWSKRAIHVSAHKQSKWWYAKRFLHPDIVAPYDYIFLWDEDLGLDEFDGEKYIELIKKHGLEISQPGLTKSGGLNWQMTRKKKNSEVHKVVKEKEGRSTLR